MGMATASPTHWTADMVRALPDDRNRYEVIDGELFVTPTPARGHQRAVVELLLQLVPYVMSRALGEAVVSPADVAFAGDTMVQPDLFVAPLAGGNLLQAWTDIKSLLLAVEVLSPSSARADRNVKRRLYQREGVPEYWIVDVNARVIERWRPEDERPEILAERLTWQPDPGIAPLEIDLERYFAEVCGEP